MKRIVIACDGTWKRLDSLHATNVLKIAQAVLPHDGAGVAQLTCHLDGVGSGRGTGRLARGLDRALGGMFGLGLTATLETAYRFLVFNYAPGDEIYLLGFSRGAYTARSLAGLIRNCGILARANAASIPRALALYRARGDGTRPEGKVAREFRARLCVDHGPGIAPRIAYLGVWDTVGALGVPESVWLSDRVNRGLGFHDTSLSRAVLSARHAVAIDERRRTFPPALWDNLAALEAGGAPGRYRQCWFPGDHGSVGGGGPVTALSDDALVWVAEGAAQAGLALDAEAVRVWRAGRDCTGPLGAKGDVRPAAIDRLVAVFGHRDREGPADPDHLAEAARLRWRLDRTWRPGALDRVAARLGGGAQAAGREAAPEGALAPGVLAGPGGVSSGAVPG